MYFVIAMKDGYCSHSSAFATQAGAEGFAEDQARENYTSASEITFVVAKAIAKVHGELILKTERILEKCSTT